MKRRDDYDVARWYFPACLEVWPSTMAALATEARQLERTKEGRAALDELVRDREATLRRKGITPAVRPW